jgi:hypothetical protein
MSVLIEEAVILRACEFLARFFRFQAL